MTEHETETAHNESDGTSRWLLGGLAGGGVILGLLIAAYAIGYHRGQDHVGTSAAPAAATTTGAATTSAATTSATTTSATTTSAATTATTATTIGPVAATPALIAQGKTLFSSEGCAGCHSLNGSAGAGPSLKGLAGGKTTLTSGQTIAAGDAYLARSITDPNAEIVKGYGAGIMAPAIAGFDLAAKPADVRALVAFIKSQK